MSLMRQFSGAPLADEESRPPIMPLGLLDATNDIADPSSPVRTFASFVVEDGKPGAERA